ncbi:hypothetical protein [Bacillus methanolicus]|nr:hypothetical protein [Bacillus methanolicus]
MIKKLYRNLLKEGWTLNEIDEMDIHFYFELMEEETETKVGFIDQVL